MNEYEKFLEKKRNVVESVGFEVADQDINQKLFDWQRAIVRWALHKGRCALFEDCGLGKTPQQLEWARHVCQNTGKNVLILAPLAVSGQTLREAKKFGIQATVCRDGIGEASGIIITNYEKLHKFTPDSFGGIVLDESSILKSFDGSTRKQITDFAKGIKFRLACTATPAPNDLIELTNHAEFLNVMSGKEIIALFFRQDGNTTHAWKLKGHAVSAFWKWMAEWSIAIRKPSDIGYDDDKFKLPELKMHQTTVSGKPMDGFLFTIEARTLQERRGARKDSLGDRVKTTADMVNQSKEHWLIWCDLNSESQMLAKAIDGAVEVTGSDDPDYKEKCLNEFATGDIRVLVSKPSIAGFGMNFQICHNVAFVGLSDSYEQFYQAIRRCWRFGQTKSVNCYVITADTEGAVVANIERKERQATEMFDRIVLNMNIHELNRKQRRNEMEYEIDNAAGNGWKMMLGDSCERIKEIQDNSIGLTVFSPPFPGMYAYTNSPRDVGNVRNFTELINHFGFLAKDLLRITMPGRSCCVHLTQEPVFKGKDGHVGLRDFRGDMIRTMTESGWIYYGEVTIDKDPQLKASRTKEHTLLFKTIGQDSASVRMALADYILQFRKPGDNQKPIKAGKHPRWNKDGGWITEAEWCEWAAPVWYRKLGPKHMAMFPQYPSIDQETNGVKETNVLKTRDAKEHDDEKHLCPLQLDVIERCVKLWSAPGEMVFSPFAGIGSEGFIAVKFHRHFTGIELKRSYWNVAVRNLKAAESNSESNELFEDK